MLCPSKAPPQRGLRFLKRRVQRWSACGRPANPHVGGGTAAIPMASPTRGVDMAETAHAGPYGGPTSSGSSGTGDGVKEQAQEKAQEVKEQAKEQASQVAGQAKSRVSTEVDNRSTQAGHQVRQQASDIRSVGEQLREQGKDGPARVADQVADRIEGVGNWLTNRSGDDILHDIEDFGRRQPWAIMAGGAALGFLASRFLKASSSSRYERRFESTYGTSSYGTPASRQLPEQTTGGYATPAGTGTYGTGTGSYGEPGYGTETTSGLSAGTESAAGFGTETTGGLGTGPAGTGTSGVGSDAEERFRREAGTGGASRDPLSPPPGSGGV